MLVKSTSYDDLEEVAEKVNILKKSMEAKWLLVHYAAILDLITSERLTNFCGKHRVF